MINEELSYCKYCKLPKHQCQRTSGEWSVDYKIYNLPCQNCLSGSGLCEKHKPNNCTGCSGIDKCNYCYRVEIHKDIPKFDPVMFKRITGIDTEPPSLHGKKVKVELDGKEYTATIE